MWCDFETLKVALVHVLDLTDEANWIAMQALLLARLEANANDNTELTQALIIPKDMEDEAIRYSLFSFITALPLHSPHNPALPL